MNNGIRVYLGINGEDETQYLIDVNRNNGYNIYLDEHLNQVYLLVNNSGDVWRATDVSFQSLQDGLYTFEEVKSNTYNEK